MEYWAHVHRRAWRDTTKAVGLEGERFWMLLVLQVIGAAAIYAILGEAGLEAAAPARIFATAVPFLAFPLVYAFKFFTVVPALAREDRAKTEELQKRLDAKPKAPSQETWITPPEAYSLACNLRGLNGTTASDRKRREMIFTEFRQLAADNELQIRGRPQKTGQFDFYRPLEFVPAAHWQTFDFKEGAYVDNDDPDDNDDVSTHDTMGVGSLATYSESERISYRDLWFRKADVERLFKC